MRKSVVWLSTMPFNARHRVPGRVIILSRFLHDEVSADRLREYLFAEKILPEIQEAVLQYGRGEITSAQLKDKVRDNL